MSIDEIEELYFGMIGQSELPPLPVSYRESDFSCGLSPILSVSDNSSNISPITPINDPTVIQGESDTDINIR